MARIFFPPATLDDLHRRHDGPPPAHAVRVAELGGRLRADDRARDAAYHHHQRLAADARLGAARRRSALPGLAVIEDSWLARLAAALAHHRHAAERRSD
ncbi:hypothetical protein [Azospirillum sp. sgz301742]